MTEIATEAIKEAVLQGHYKPGKRLIPAQLESELNLGRVAIREALRELTGSGLVVSVPNKGAIVAEAVDAEEMREVFEIRYDLEGKACELAATRISEEELSKLERLNVDLAGYQENPGSISSSTGSSTWISTVLPAGTSFVTSSPSSLIVCWSSVASTQSARTPSLLRRPPRRVTGRGPETGRVPGQGSHDKAPGVRLSELFVHP